MKTYNELKERLCKVGFKDVSMNYRSAAPVFLHVGYGHNKERWPHFQVSVFRTQEVGARMTIYWQDWMEATGEAVCRVNSLEQVWTAAMRVAKRALASPIYKLEEVKS